jgi:phosphoribosylglycinamide formyltransferase-1
MMENARPQALRLAFFASGNGSGMRAVAAAAARSEVQAEVCLVVSNRPDCGAISWAEEHGIETMLVTGESTDRDQAHCLEALILHEIEIIVLTGYLRKIGQAVLDRYSPNILNVHPSLLPRFGGKGMYGDHVHRAVLDAGETVTGASIHIIDADYDTGPVVAQDQIKIREAETVETLACRVKQLEGKLLVEILRRIQNGQIQL